MFALLLHKNLLLCQSYIPLRDTEQLLYLYYLVLRQRTLCRCLRRGDGGARPAEWQTAPPVEAPRTVPVSTSRDATGHSHPWQVLRHAAQRDRVLSLLPEQGREYLNPFL